MIQMENLKPLYLYAGVEQLKKGMANGGSQGFQLLEWEVMNKQEEDTSMGHVALD